MKLVPIVLLALAPAALHGQVQGDSTARAVSCRAGLTPGPCRASVLWHVGYLHPLIATAPSTDNVILIELGFLHRAGPRSAIGANLFGLMGDGGVGVGFRYRRWLDSSVALDLTPQIGVSSFQFSGAGLLHSPALGASVTGREYLGLSLRLQADRVASYDEANGVGRQTNWTFLGGVHVGSHLGAVASGALGLVLAGTLLAFAASH